MATIREVATAAKVAPITVSRVLNDPDTVAPATRARVEATIRELKYVPNLLGQGLRHRRTQTIGLVIADIRNPYYVPMILAVEAVARDHGYDVMLTNADRSADLESRLLHNLVKRRVDGVVLAPIYNTPTSVEFVQEQGIPICVVDYRMPENEVAVVRSDSVAAAAELTRYVIDLGHRRLAMLTGPESIVTARDRAQGYRAAVEDAGLDPAANPVFFGSFEPDLSRDIAARILATEPRPTALVTASNFIALGAARAARDAGLDVPTDLSIVTFDGPQSEYVLDPFFTCEANPAYEIAHTATTLLFEQITSPAAPTAMEVVLPTSLIVNASAGPPPPGI